jgi:hypothetical protein
MTFSVAGSIWMPLGFRWLTLDAWQPAIEKALAETETCAVFVGPSGFGPWQNEEMHAAIDRRVHDSGRSFRVIRIKFSWMSTLLNRAWTS